jgi:hypothetical protein
LRTAHHGEVLAVSRQRQASLNPAIFVILTNHLHPPQTGSGVSPFIPVTSPSSLLATFGHAILFIIRLPIFLVYATVYFILLHNLPLPAFARKIFIWLLLAIPGIWWVDLQIDGVKRGSLSQQPPSRVPHPGSVIAANFTSPIDALYLAAVFDPIFVSSYPGSQQVRHISLVRAIFTALSRSLQLHEIVGPFPDVDVTDLPTLMARYPNRVIAIFPECGTTNGRGILPLSPCLLAVPADKAIFPLSMRYTPPDVTTPVPGFKAWRQFLWKLLGRPTHCIRVRIAEGIYNTTQASNGAHSSPPPTGDLIRDERTAEKQRLLDRVAEDLARLGRAKRVGLTMRDKQAFVEAWEKRK